MFRLIRVGYNQGMSKESIVLTLGIVVLFAPILGVPDAWKQYALMFAGALLVVVGYLLRRNAYYRHIDQGNGEFSTDSFVESRPEDFEEEETEVNDYRI